MKIPFAVKVIVTLVVTSYAFFSIIQANYFPPLSRSVTNAGNSLLADLDKRLHSGSKIPRIVHQIWISRQGDGSNPLPLELSLFAIEMKNVHQAQGWEYHLWCDELYDIYKDDPYVGTYRQSSLGADTLALLTDRLRLLILRDYGGVFTDIDSKVITSDGFESILRKIPAQTTFFAGTRRLKDNDHQIEVAVLGSAPRSRVILGTLNEYPSFHGFVPGFPSGIMVARWMAYYYDENSLLFNYHYFYTTDKNNEVRPRKSEDAWWHFQNETIILQDMHTLGNWRSTIGTAFVDVWRPETKKHVIKMLDISFKLANAWEVPSFLGGRGLLGYARNGTFHPFDDEIDILIYKPDKDKKKDGQIFTDALLAALRADGYDGNEFWGGLKIYPKDAPKVQKFQWGYPFLDVRLYSVSDDKKNVEYDNKKYPYDVVYPITKVEMEGIQMNVPNDPDQFCQTLFFKDYVQTCKSRSWEREKEEGIFSLTVPCEKLVSLYPFNKGPYSKSNMKLKQTKLMFAPAWNAKTEKAYFELLQVAMTVCKKAKIETWLGGTSLLGLIRNQTLHPWDDGVDLMIEAVETSDGNSPAHNFKKKCERAFNDQGYKIYEYWGGFKLFREATLLNRGTPSLDLRWYSKFKANQQTVIKVSEGPEFTQEDIFPLQSSSLRSIFVTKRDERSVFARMFGRPPTDSFSIQVKVPHSLPQVASIWFGADYKEMCRSRGWDRELETNISQVAVPCSEISTYHPFRNRQ